MTTVAALIELIGNVETMGGDVLTEILAPSEIRAIAETVVAANIQSVAEHAASALPPHLAWMATVPAYMHDCFAS